MGIAELKKLRSHDGSYLIISEENEMPKFIKLTDISSSSLSGYANERVLNFNISVDSIEKFYTRLTDNNEKHNYIHVKGRSHCHEVSETPEEIEVLILSQVES